jgi:hypothetical protein
MALHSRRNFLLACSAGAGLYVYHRGLRYPRLGFEHRSPPSQFSLRETSVKLEHAIVARDNADHAPTSLRAIAPEPTIHLQSLAQEKLTLEVTNIATDSRLEVSGSSHASVHENISGINRKLEIAIGAEQSINLAWRVADQEGAYFAVIGDTGGGHELQWVLQRAEKLGAQFLLHLGDFNYSEGEYGRAIELFKAAPFPCYVSIGNHDYNASGLIYHQFLNQIGPMNHSFTLAGVRFVNLDSAADFFPASAGRRGDLIENLKQDQTEHFDQVVFTHRPFQDPRAGQDHVIGGIGEIDWLHNQILALGAKDILTGHVHRSAELDFAGLHQWTAGEGLGFEDIVHQKQVAKLLMGKIELGSRVTYQWQALDMPWASHLSPTHEIKLQKEQSKSKLDWYRQKVPHALI